MRSKKLRSGIAQTLQNLIDENGCRVVGDWTGHDKSCISRWGSKLSSWDVAAFLDVLEQDAACRNAVHALIDEIEAKARPTTPELASMIVLQKGSDLNSKISTAMMDGHVDSDEAQSLVPEIDAQIKQLTEAKLSLGRLVGAA